jgi:hypothetical protein
METLTARSEALISISFKKDTVQGRIVRNKHIYLENILCFLLVRTRDYWSSDADLAARTNPKNSGCGRLGRDLNSGWN